MGVIPSLGLTLIARGNLEYTLRQRAGPSDSHEVSHLLPVTSGQKGNAQTSLAFVL